MKFLNFIKSKKFKSTIFIFIFLVSLCFNIRTFLGPSTLNVIKGSYSNNPANLPGDNEYFVFAQDGTFCRYKQFEPLDEGTYSSSSDSLHILKSDLISQCIILDDEHFYFYDTDKDEVLEFTKFSNVPAYINIKSPPINKTMK